MESFTNCCPAIPVLISEVPARKNLVVFGRVKLEAFFSHVTEVKL
jgi:hypothetical protein